MFLCIVGHWTKCYEVKCTVWSRTDWLLRIFTSVLCWAFADFWLVNVCTSLQGERMRFSPLLSCGAHYNFHPSRNQGGEEVFFLPREDNGKQNFLCYSWQPVERLSRVLRLMRAKSAFLCPLHWSTLSRSAFSALWPSSLRSKFGFQWGILLQYESPVLQLRIQPQKVVWLVIQALKDNSKRAKKKRSWCALSYMLA